MELYKKLFEVILTDNGSEFFYPVSIEKDNEEVVSYVFYCDPGASWQKGVIEKNHEYIRYILPKKRSFDGAIVCGILAPSTQANLCQEILDYAKKMGYVTDTMKPVKMFRGTKSFIFNNDGTYSIFFSWYNSILKTINQELLDKFTKDFFSNHPVEVKSNGVLMANLSEDKVFSRENIDIFREYDIQLLYLDPKFDKKLLLRAVIQRAFIHLPCNTLRREESI